MVSKTKLMIVDDHAIVRIGFVQLFTITNQFEVVCEANRGEEIIQKYESSQPDVVLMDISMPGIGGLESTQRLVNRYPDAKVIMFSIFHEDVYIDRALSAGAKGFVTKSGDPEVVFQAIAQVMQGGVYIENKSKEYSLNVSIDLSEENIGELSEREFDVFRLFVLGLSVKQIGDELCLASKTVANYVTGIKKKLGAKSGVELVKIADRMGINQAYQ